MSLNEHDARLRRLEQDHANAIARLDNVEGQQRATWAELRALRTEQRNEYETLRKDQKEDTEKLMIAINANKIAWSMMNSGTKVAAWLILALASVAGAVSAVVMMVKRLFV